MSGPETIRVPLHDTVVEPGEFLDRLPRRCDADGPLSGWSVGDRPGKAHFHRVRNSTSSPLAGWIAATAGGVVTAARVPCPGLAMAITALSTTTSTYRTAVRNGYILRDGATRHTTF